MSRAEANAGTAVKLKWELLLLRLVLGVHFIVYGLIVYDLKCSDIFRTAPCVGAEKCAIFHSQHAVLGRKDYANACLIYIFIVLRSTRA